MKKCAFLSLILAIIIASQAHAKAPLCSKVFLDIKTESALLRQSLGQKNPTELVDTYFYAEFSAAKAVAIKPGSRLSDIDSYDAVVRKNTDRLNIEKVMKDFSLSRFEAIEVQALLRHHTKSPNDQQFLTAVEAVRAGKSLSKLNLAKIKKAKLTLALDIDGTLLDQDSNHKWIPNVHEKSFLVDGSKIHHVALNPGAISLIRKAKELGAAIVLFSRNNDLLIHEILRSFEIDGTRLSDYVDGVLTSSHMTVPPEARAEIGETEISRLVKKDLRVFGTSRILLIDDNPDYVLQLEQMRAVREFSLDDAFDQKEFKPKDHLSEKENEAVAKILESMNEEYRQVIMELEYLMIDPRQFKNRQLAFSPLGNEAYSLLTDTNKNYFIQQKKSMTGQEAMSFLLTNPDQIHAILAKKKPKKKKENSLFNFGSFYNMD